MSKVGRKPIDISGVQVNVNGQEVHYKGPKNTGLYTLPKELSAVVEDKNLKITADVSAARVRDINRVWGLHRSLLANEIKGAASEFVKQVKITGLGYKAVASGNKLVFSLGYSHKIDFEVPKNVSIETDRSGQLLTLKSPDKELLGSVVSKIEELRKSEPYKGTGILETTKSIIRKSSKGKA